MKISWKLKLFSILAFFHGLVVLLGASDIRLHHAGPVGEIITWYGALTGAERGFGFFAPSVNTQARVSFLIVDQDGRAHEEPMGTHLSEEGRLRLNNLASKFWQAVDGDNLTLKRSMAASWTTDVFERHPNAEKVELSLQLFQIPSMKHFQGGQRPSWRTIYQAKFRKKRHYASR